MADEVLIVEETELLLQGTPDPELLVADVPGPVELVELVTQGPAGPPGNVAHYAAAATVQGHKAVSVAADGRLVLADAMTPLHLGTVAGVSTNAAMAGEDVAVRTGDLIEHPGWSFAPDAPVFVGAAGALVQAAPPGAAWLQVLGWARSPTTLLVALQPPIQLNGGT